MEAPAKQKQVRHLTEAGILVFVVAMSGPAPAQQANAAAQSPRELLRSVLEIAKADDLANADFLGRKLGLRFIAPTEKENLSGGRGVETPVRLRLQRYDRAVFDLNRGPVYYDIYQSSGKSTKQRVDFAISLATRTMCITSDDFVAVFGPGAKRWESTDNGGFGYSYRIEQANQISVKGFFGHRKCMQDLGMSQNMD